MIYITNKAESKDKASLVLKKEAETLTCAVVHNKKTYPLTISRSLARRCPDIVHLGFSVAKGIYCFSSTDARESRSGLSFSYESNAAHCQASMSCFGSIWIPKSGSGFTFFFNSHVEVFAEGFSDSDIHEVHGYCSADKLFSEVIPDAAGYLKRSAAKQKLIKQINELDSLAMLEAQLDLLTRFVLTGEGKKALAAAVKDCLTTSVHTDEKLQQTIWRQKTYLRNLQKTYFKEKGDFNNGNFSS